MALFRKYVFFVECHIVALWVVNRQFWNVDWVHHGVASFRGNNLGAIASN
jgi:hypothetical protein